jgi:hypothetical protein
MRNFLFALLLCPSSFPGGPGGATATLLATDRQGFLYIAGYTDRQDVVVTEQAYMPTHSRGKDIFLVKIDPKAGREAAIVYGTYLGGSGDDIPRALAVEPDGTVYITGSTTSTDFPLSANAYQTKMAGDADMFLVKIRPSAVRKDSLVYSTYLGGKGFDSGDATGVAPDGTVYVAGVTLSSDFPAIGDSVQAANAGGSSSVLVIFDPDAAAGSSVFYTTHLGGNGGGAATHLAKHGMDNDSFADVWLNWRLPGAVRSDSQ